MAQRFHWRSGPAVFPAGAVETLPAWLAAVLAEDAVPARFFHFFLGDGTLTRMPGSGGRTLVGIGHAGTGAVIGVDVDSREVRFASAGAGAEASYINASQETFAAFMALCERGYPFYPDDDEGDFDVSEAAAQTLRAEMARMDPAAVAPGRYWSDFLADVANGDYGG